MIENVSPYAVLLVLFMIITGLSLAYAGVGTDKTDRRNGK